MEDVVITMIRWNRKSACAVMRRVNLLQFQSCLGKNMVQSDTTLAIKSPKVVMSERCPGKRLGLFAYDRTKGKENRNLYWRGEKKFALVLY